MALGSPVTISANGVWVQAITAGGLARADAGPGVLITDPVVQITDSTRRFLVMPSGGKFMRIALEYPVGLSAAAGESAIIDPVVQAFGFEWNAGAQTASDPQVLTSMCGDVEITLWTDPDTDVIDDDVQYTLCRREEHTIDCQDCGAVLFGIKTVLTACDQQRVLAAALRVKSLG